MTWGTAKPTGSHKSRPARRLLTLGLLVISAMALSGCATAVIGSLTVSQISTIAGVASAATTGRGLQDHALSAVTGRDCRLLEGIIRESRRICEEPGSPATEDDFRGFVVLIMGPPEDEADVLEADDTLDQPVGEPVVLYAGLESNFRPSLTRRTRRSGAAPMALALDDAGDMPSILEWAIAQPSPALPTTAQFSN